MFALKTSRRDFLQLAAAATGAAAVSGLVPQSLSAALSSGPPAGRAPRVLRILILGGTGFTGPHQIRYAVERGHHITVFNRGRSEADLPASVVHLEGDRNEPDGLAALRSAVANGERWDVVIDNPTTLPHWVRDAGEVLSDATQHYIFISTISVYGDTSRPGMDETTVVAQYEGADPMAETMQTYQASRGGLYGPLKAISEREAERQFPGRATIIRPGLIVGPRDMSGRFTYWPVRIARGGEIMAPGTGHDSVQIIDARDLAEWTIRVAENRVIGMFNATGPAGHLTMAEMLGGVRGAFDGNTKLSLTWIPAEFLAEHNIRGWSHMPVWMAPRPDNAGLLSVSIQRALDAGLTYRPLATTARDTLEWYRSLPADVQARVGGPLTAEREAEVLRAWHARAGA
jgi:2'-hydroxyisoflavone reductase